MEEQKQVVIFFPLRNTILPSTLMCEMRNYFYNSHYAGRKPVSSEFTVQLTGRT